MCAGIFGGLFIGILMGFTFSSMAYKPLFDLQNKHMKFVEAENKRIQKSYMYFAIEIEGCKQFMDNTISMRLIRKLGLEGHFIND